MGSPYGVMPRLKRSVELKSLISESITFYLFIHAISIDKLKGR